VLSITRKEFATVANSMCGVLDAFEATVAANASSTPHMLFAVAQTMAASVFYALHDKNACITTQTGIAFAPWEFSIKVQS